MKKTLVILMFTVVTFLLGLTAKDMNKLQHSGDYIVGKGIGTTEEMADKSALRDLSSQIIVEVKSSYLAVAKEHNFSVDEYCESVVETFSNIQLNDAKKLTDPKSKEGRYQVYRYISIEDKRKIFSDRKTQVFPFVSEGEIAEEDGNVVDALRNYYWALMLLKAHPESKTISYWLDGEERTLNNALYSKLEQLLAGIKITVDKISKFEDSNCTDIILQASYNELPTDGILVKYHDGYAWSESEKWSNGIGYIDLKNSMFETMKKIDLKIDYSFLNQGFSGDVALTLGSMQQITFENAEKQIHLKKRTVEAVKNSREMISFDKSISETKLGCLDNVIEAICQKDLVLARRHFTARGFKDFNSLIGYGNAEILPVETELAQLNIGEISVVRSIPLKFKFNKSNEEFTEKVNFVFDKNEKIIGVTFALSDKAIQDIMGKKYGTAEEKALIVNFVEQYKTAYCLKDIDFIKDLFSEDALIIVGKVVERKADEFSDKLYQQLGDKLIEYVNLSKSEYLTRLEEGFGRKEFINIRFSENKIDRVTDKSQKIYGMQIGQYYYSSNYSDFGYLFLMFDLQNPDLPKIIVRSWQPEKSEDGSIIGIDNFEFE